MLQDGEVKTYLSRNTDETMGLLTRTSLINNMKCDYSVSVHCNASENREAAYIATYIQAIGGEAEKLAAIVQAHLVAATGWTDGGIKVANLHMNREVKCPSILVECGFISNLEQEQELGKPEIQSKIAGAIAQGFMEYMNIEPAKEANITMNIDKALKILQGKGIISSPDYWKMAAQCVRYLDNLLINVANYVK